MIFSKLKTTSRLGELSSTSRTASIPCVLTKCICRSGAPSSTFSWDPYISIACDIYSEAHTSSRLAFRIASSAELGCISSINVLILAHSVACLSRARFASTSIRSKESSIYKQHRIVKRDLDTELCSVFSPQRTDRNRHPPPNQAGLPHLIFWSLIEADPRCSQI